MRPQLFCLDVVVGYQSAEVRAFDNNESELFLLGEKYAHTAIVTPFLGDVACREKGKKIIDNSEIISEYLT